MIVKLSKIEIIGLRKHFDGVSDLLLDKGNIHLEEIPLATKSCSKGFLKRISFDQSQRKKQAFFSDMSKVLREILPVFEPSFHFSDEEIIKAEEEYWKKNPQEIYKLIAGIKRKIKSLLRRKRNLEDDIKLTEKYSRLFPLINKSLQKLKIEDSYEFCGIIYETMREKELNQFKTLLGKITENTFEFIETRLDKKHWIGLIAFHKNYDKTVKDFLWKKEVTEISFPKSLGKKSFSENFKELSRQWEEIPEKKANIEKEFHTFIQEHALVVMALNHICNSRKLQYLEAEKFAASKYTFIIRGYIPTDEVEDLQNILEQKYSGEVIANITKDFLKEDKTVPVKLKNNKFLKPFELLMALLPPPNYGSMDPTLILAIFFPLFYGFILGDIGYGLVIIALAFLMKKKSKNQIISQVAHIAIVCGISSIFFGALFGEFFGTLGHHLFGHNMITIIAERDKILNELLLFSVIIGYVHILLSTIIGMIYSLKKGKTSHFLASLGLFLVLVAISHAVVGYIYPEYGNNFVLAGIFMTGVVLLYRGEGITGVLEIISVFANIISYARLMAIGVTSVILANLANEAALGVHYSYGIPIAALIHILNIALGIFSPTIQSLRLHYVEFFPKFYHPDGRNFIPFSKVSSKEK